MLKIILKGHDNYYGIGDVVRMFYGPCRELRSENAVICDCGPDLVIKSTAHDDGELPINRQVKRDLYKTISELTDKEFPWGSLTGIRPTIVAREEGFEPEALSRKYFVRQDKAKLACETAKYEYDLARKGQEGLNVYVGVPMCPGRCEYCSFIAEDATRHLDRLPQYADALIKEMNCIKPFITKVPVSIYMGGGTPTVFGDEDFRRVATCIKDCFKSGAETEFTVEAGRPDTITQDKLEAMREAGVQRICINPQTMRDETLMNLHRGHSSEDTVRAFEMAREAGFEVINMDLIAGLKYETADDFLYSLREVLKLEPENVTIHTLYRKRRASMTREDVMNSEGRGDIDEALAQAYDELYKRGYAPYYLYRQKDTESGLENTGFCKNNTACVYNVAMMSETCDVLSVGAGGMSKRYFGEGRFERCPCVKDISTYMRFAEEMAERKINFFDLRPRAPK